MSKLVREDLVKFHRTWFMPNNATLVVVGDTTMAEIRPKIEKLFKDWKGGKVPEKNIAAVTLPAKPRVYIMDKPGAPQSVVVGGHTAPPSGDPDAIAIETMNTILGGDFVSRINMNIREEKHWSYGAQSILLPARGPEALRRPRPGPVRQDQGDDGRDPEGARRDPGREARHPRRVRQRQEQQGPRPARPVGDHGGGRGLPVRDRPVRPAR